VMYEYQIKVVGRKPWYNVEKYYILWQVLVIILCHIN